MLVPVRLYGQDFDFLVDTGAAYAAISPALAVLFDLVSSPHHLTIAPAQGVPFSVPQVLLSELRIGGMRLSQVAALIVAFPSVLRLPGLIGMNVLRHFRVTLESDTSTLVLRPVPG